MVALFGPVVEWEPAVCLLMCTTSGKAQLSTHDLSFPLLQLVITHHPPLLPVADLHLTALVVVATYQMSISFFASNAMCRNTINIVDKALVTKVSFTAVDMHSSIAKICTQQEKGDNSLQCTKYKHHFLQGHSTWSIGNIIFGVTVMGDCTSFTCTRSKITKVVCALEVYAIQARNWQFITTITMHFCTVFNWSLWCTSYSNTRVVKLFVSTNGTVTHNHATTLTSTFANTVHLISTGGGTNVKRHKFGTTL